jgi:hypothetical protein
LVSVLAQGIALERKDSEITKENKSKGLQV